MKRISDYWDWEYFRALEAFDSDEMLARLEDNYRFILPEADPKKGVPGCHWENVRDLQENVGVGLQTILQRIELANSDTLAGIFGDVQWANKEKLPEHTLLNVIEEFSTLDLSPDNAPGDILGAAYEYLLKYFADRSGQKAGEFFTPRSVVRLLTLILAPEEGDNVHDPTCGSGGMLVEMANVVREQDGDPRTLSLSGQEVSLTTAAIARMNLYLHDIEDFSIRRGDTLREPRFKTPGGELESFDIVIANPPFAHTPWGYETWANDPYGRSRYGVPPASTADYAFIEHMLASIEASTGRIGVVMPQSALFRGGADGEIRRRIAEVGLIDCVIGLPPNLFYNTTQPTCILILRAATHRSRDKGVLFIDASRCFVKAGPRNEIPNPDVSAIAEIALTGDTTDPRLFGEFASLDVIAVNHWKMSIGKYVAAAADKDIEAGESIAVYHDALTAFEVASAQLNLRLKEAGFLES